MGILFWNSAIFIFVNILKWKIVMENYIISRYLRLFEALSIEVKLELLSKLTESIHKGFKKPQKDKTTLLNELFGAWSDIDDEKIIKEIYNSRSITDKSISFD
jgi:hypothetical protein